MLPLTLRLAKAAQAQQRAMQRIQPMLDALRRKPHPTHFTLEQAIVMARRIGASRTYFTHIAHDLGHAAVSAELPPGMALAYDGLRIDC